MNFLREEIISDIQIFKNPFQLQDQLSFASALLHKVLEVHGMVKKEGHLELVHVLNLFYHYVVIRMPILGIILQVPEHFK